MINCIWQPIDPTEEAPQQRRFQCVMCGRIIEPSEGTKRAKSHCRSIPIHATAAPPPGLGDWIHAQLARVGFTREVWRSMRGRYRVVGGFNCRLERLPELPACGCDSRRDALNELGRWLLAAWQAIKVRLRWGLKLLFIAIGGLVLPRTRRK